MSSSRGHALNPAGNHRATQQVRNGPLRPVAGHSSKTVRSKKARRPRGPLAEHHVHGRTRLREGHCHHA